MDLMYVVRMGAADNDSRGDVTESSDDVALAPIETDLALTVPYLILTGIALLSGSVGNCLVIASVVIDKDLRTVGNLFIVNLALADLCVTGFVDPFSVVGILLGEQWFIGKGWLCEAIASVCLTSCFCSLLSIGAISFNRYIHICHDSHYKQIFTLTKTILMCIGLWVISFLAEIPNFLGWGDHVYDKKTMSCVWDRTADLSYTIFFSSVGVLFPIILISICYVRIYTFVRRSRNKVGRMRSKAADAKTDVDVSKEKEDSVRLARTLFLIFVLFSLCWLPYAIIIVADVNDTFPTALHSYAIAVAHANSSVNSILYGVTNRQFRNSYLRILHLDKCVKRRTAPLEFSRTNEAPTNTVEIISQGRSDVSHMQSRGPYIRDQANEMTEPA